MKSNATSRGHAMAVENDFRAFLQAELLARCGRNPAYSLRAFAHDLGLDHSTLSQILRSKRTLTARNIVKMGQALSLPENEITAFVEREQWSAGASHTPREQVDQLAQEAAIVLSDWIHYALLELTHVSGFRTDSRWIADVLGVDTDAVNIALSRLARLGLLRMEAVDRWVSTTARTVGREAFPEVTIRQLLARVHALGTDNTRDGPAPTHEHSTTTLAISHRRVPEAIACLARLRRELLALAEQDGEEDDIYRLEVHFRPLTTEAPTPERKESNHGL